MTNRPRQSGLVDRLLSTLVSEPTVCMPAMAVSPSAVHRLRASEAPLPTPIPPCHLPSSPAIGGTGES